MQHISRLTGQLPLCSKKAFPRHIGRTKGGLNSKLHAVCDGQGRPVRLHLTAGQVSDFKGADVLLADLPDETVIKSGSRSQNGRSPLVFRRRRTGNQSHFTTSIYIKSAITSKTCSQGSNTGGGWQHDMTAAYTLSCPLSTSQ